MELLFVGVACTDEAINESNKKYYNSVGQVRPQQYFDLNLISGLSKQCSVTAISIPPVSSFPKNKCLFYHRKQDIVSEKLRIKYITLLNLSGIKTIIIMLSVFISTLCFCIKNRKKNVGILMGYILFYTSIPSMLVAKAFRVKIFAIVPDVPKYINSYTKVSNPIRYIFTKLSIVLDRLVESRFDGYVLLTEQINELVNPQERPHIVVEGMIKKDDVNFKNIQKEGSLRIIMYAGTLHKKFGIKKLVEAFKLCKIDNCELWIFGVGDYVDSLKKDTIENKNIKYKGTASRSEIIRLERKATLLVNPRPSNEEFTKYSFPSKTIEYMASGTPLLTTRLPGIPEEYFEYVFLFDGEEIAEMATEINRILSFPVNKLNDYGEKARNFILKNKNEIVQAQKIYEFLTKNI